jgi:predicted nucleic acid-binding protein
LALASDAAFLAGNFFRDYLKRGGARTRILADFIVAAQAQLPADRLLTNDKRFYGTSFPNLKAISPEDL